MYKMKISVLLILILIIPSCYGTWWSYIWAPLKFSVGIISDPINNYFNPVTIKKLGIYCPQGKKFYTKSGEEKEIMEDFHKSCQCPCCKYGTDGHKWKNTGKKNTFVLRNKKKCRNCGISL